jgi:DNA-directed RNA polymerase subunit RPC12/RpoP
VIPIAAELECRCFYCEQNRLHPERHEGEFERKSNVSSDTLEPGAAVEFCTVCGHERLVKGYKPIK